MNNLNKLNDFDLITRTSRLSRLAAELTDIPREPIVNGHGHSFYSHNGEGWSPQRILWEAHQQKLAFFGMTEFDVLDSMEQSFSAGELLGVPVFVNLETRTFCQTLAGEVINSPGEMGVSYAMGAAFHSLPSGDNKVFLDNLFTTSRARNVAMMDLINGELGNVAKIDYARDVLPLTPKRNATERHMVVAYANMAASNLKGSKLVTYWSTHLQQSEGDVRGLIAEPAKLQAAIRSKFMKEGGVGYVRPDSGSFPDIGEFFAWVKSCGAVPTATWLNGNTVGEANPGRLLDIYRDHGAQALNIIPDRNYAKGETVNPEDIKYRNLQAVIAAAQKKDMPLVMGTELNAPGLPFVDNWEGVHLAPYRELALDGAKYMHQHTVAGRELQ